MRSFLNVDFEEFLKSSQVKSSQVKSLYGNAKPIQADDGSGRGPARGLLRWAKVSVGSGDRRCRASTALVDRARPVSDEFWRFGPDKGTSIDFGQATWAAGAAAAKEWSRSFLRCAPHTPPCISYACPCAYVRLSFMAHALIRTLQSDPTIIIPT